MAEIVPVVAHDGSQVDDIHDDKQKHFEAEHVEGGVEQVKHEILVEDANKAEHFEHEMSTWQAFKMYKAAVFWSIVASMSIIMEGYDWGLQGNLWGMIEYRKTFGSYYPELDDWQPTAAWQSAIGQAPSIGAIFGVYWGAWLNDRYGYRKSLMINYAICIPIVFIFFFATNKAMLLVAGLLIGFPFGCFACLGEAYASEICPVKLRAYMTGYVNICWNIGGFVSSGVINGTQTIPNNWSWRIPYATQWLWPVPLIILSFLAPESPWWLVRNGKLQEAERSLKRLGGKAMEHRAHEQLANMLRTTQLEKDLAASNGSGRWIDIFKGVDLRRTEITVFVWVLQNFSGAMFAGNTTYVFQQAGISQSVAYDLGWGTSAIQLGANFLNMFLLYHFGRRTIYIAGFAYCTVNLLIVGVAAVYGIQGNAAAKWVQAGVQMAFMIGYTGFLGPTCYAIISETSSTRLRNKTLAFARMCYSIQGIVFNILNAYMINPTAFGWQGKTAFFWAPCAALSAVWCWYRLPELKDRSYYEINLLFQKKLPARQFKGTVIDANSEEAIREQQLGGH